MRQLTAELQTWAGGLLHTRAASSKSCCSQESRHADAGAAGGKLPGSFRLLQLTTNSNFSMPKALGSTSRFSGASRGYIRRSSLDLPELSFARLKIA